MNSTLAKYGSLIIVKTVVCLELSLLWESLNQVSFKFNAAGSIRCISQSSVQCSLVSMWRRPTRMRLLIWCGEKIYSRTHTHTNNRELWRAMKTTWVDSKCLLITYKIIAILSCCILAGWKKKSYTILSTLSTTFVTSIYRQEQF